MTGEHPNTKEAPTTDERVSHTPGPWRAYKPHPHNPWWCVQAENREIAEVETGAHAAVWNDPHSPEAVEANARLMAAAPDLLESLKEMGDWIAGGLQASGEAWPDAKCLQHTEEIAARARAAIDKAEGRS